MSDELVVRWARHLFTSACNREYVTEDAEFDGYGDYCSCSAEELLEVWTIDQVRRLLTLPGSELDSFMEEEPWYRVSLSFADEQCSHNLVPRKRS